MASATLYSELLTFLSTLKVTQGRNAGQPFKVFPWQRKFLRKAFSPRITESALTVSRGNGKTTLLAAIARATLDGPLSVARGETIIVASSFEQARILFEHCLSFLGDEVEDRRTWRIWDSAQLARIEYKPLKSRVRCLASDPRRAHGIAPVLSLLDEPAQWPESTAEKMLSAISTSAGKLPMSRMVSLGTKAADPDHWFSKMLAGGCDYAQEHSVPLDADPFDKKNWRKANPSLAYMPDLLAAMTKEAERARVDPMALQSFKALRLNMGLADTLESVLVSTEAWAEAETPDAEGKGKYYLGLDLGTNASQSAAAAYWPDTYALDAFGVFPEIPDLEARGVIDGCGLAYLRMASRGELITAGERVSDIKALLREVLARWGAPYVIVTDRWREAELRQSLSEVGFPMARLEVRGMGWKDGGEDVRLFRAAVLDGKVKAKPSLLLRTALASARTVSDPAGNAKLRKRVRRPADDAAAASIMAVGAGVRGSGGQVDAAFSPGVLRL